MSARGYSTRRQRGWKITNPGNQAIREEVVRAALAAAAEPIAGDGALLDAGCGRGWWMRTLAGAGVARDRLYGIDLEPSYIELASGIVPAEQLRVGDVRELPYDDGAFTAVFAMLVLSTLPDADSVRRAAAEFRRVLAPGGVFVVWDARVWTTNPITRVIRAEELGPGVESHTLTVLPPLARRLGRAAPRVYGPLSRVPLLRTHRLYVVHR